ncbi:hypothetical protein GCM10027051_32020 [Niabella terrae]
MKKLTTMLTMAVLSLFFSQTVLAQDTLYSVNNWGTVGITQYTNVNPTTGTFSGTTSTYASADNVTSSAALAVNSNGTFIYYIPNEAANQGVFEVFSIPAFPHSSQAIEPTAGTMVMTAQDLNGAGNTNELYFRRLATNTNGWAYMVTSEDVTGTIYLSRFLTHADGTATDFQELGTVTLDGVALTNNFYNGDIAFDAMGNLYALVNDIAGGGLTNVYYIPAADLAAAVNASSVTDMKFKYSVKDPGGDDFTGLVTGIAFSSAGNLFFSIQGVDGGIYFFSRTGVDMTGDISVTGPVSTFSSDNLADLTSSYFPVNNVLPVNWGTVSAKIRGNSLQVDFSTLSETNNASFAVQVSADGNQFETVKTISSQADNGNSDKVLNYSVTIGVDSSTGLVLGISIMVFAFGLLLINRKNKWLTGLTMAVGMIVLGSACSKPASEIDVKGVDKLYVKIVQTDIDGHSTQTDIITAYRVD